MESSDKEIFDCVGDLMVALLNSMTIMETKKEKPGLRYSSEFKEQLVNSRKNLEASDRKLRNMPVPRELGPLKTRLLEIVTLCLQGPGILPESSDEDHLQNDGLDFYFRALEKLYPLGNIFRPVSQFFLEKEKHDDFFLMQSLSRETPEFSERGIHHRNNSPDQRGGFSFYVPENKDKNSTLPLVVALHGGGGHGANYLWNWLKEARSRGFLLICPTSIGGTWSLEDVHGDLVNIKKAMGYIKRRFKVKTDKILLTGMSDGASYTMLAGLRKDSLFTHLAPFSGIFPATLDNYNTEKIDHGKPVYLVHGTEDMVFPIETAFMTKSELESIGAKVTFKQIQGLRHSYARDEHASLLKWFDSELEI
ncbi:MAG: hypothetical protein CMQ40_00720 [Gammaproteobacteria bacterium]|nr:hypothetical protein [Gammaproteobacteria bacterium]